MTVLRALPAIFLLMLVAPAAADAHETREVAGTQIVAGWQEEPPYAGFKNAVSIQVTRNGSSVHDVRLSVEVSFGGSLRKASPMPLSPVPVTFAAANEEQASPFFRWLIYASSAAAVAGLLAGLFVRRRIKKLDERQQANKEAERESGRGTRKFSGAQ